MRVPVQGNLLETLPPSRYLDLSYEPTLATLWVTLKPEPKPNLTIELIEEFNRLGDAIRHEHGRMAPSPNQPLKFVVLQSPSDKVFNLGGDLDHFVSAIEAGKGDLLRAYGRAGAMGCHHLAWGFDASVVTISLVRGIAVGGGFEVARCCNLMVAEDGASFQLPEAGFGLFPASGIISVISPRLGQRMTRRMVIDSERVTCPEALAEDVIDAIAPAGAGERAVRDLIGKLTPRHAAAVATYRGLNRMAGATHDALQTEADLWARSAMNLSADSLITMRRLSRAQTRRFQTEEKGLDTCH